MSTFVNFHDKAIGKLLVGTNLDAAGTPPGLRWLGSKAWCLEYLVALATAGTPVPQRAGEREEWLNQSTSAVP